ncbi:cysteine hydrolase family protein [Flavitalea flava]
MEQNTQNTALLVMDMQTSILGMLPDSTRIKASVARALDNARSNNIPVIYIVVGFRPGWPEGSVNNKNLAVVKERFGSANMEDFLKVDPSILPQENELIVVKRRVSAFTGSDLEVLLRAKNIQHLVLSGIATSGVVLSTLREAADKDYRLTVLADCCADGDEEVHRVLTTKVFPRQADVILVDEWN